ncbi:MAG: hypothetical protein WCP18_02790 [bacterium]
MLIDEGPQNLKDILLAKKKQTIKPPAYEWQDLALRLINELAIPNFKRNSVFKVCRDNSKATIEKALNETKELAKTEQWKYFFKVLDSLNNKKTIEQ